MALICTYIIYTWISVDCYACTSQSTFLITTPAYSIFQANVSGKNKLNQRCFTDLRYCGTRDCTMTMVLCVLANCIHQSPIHCLEDVAIWVWQKVVELYSNAMPLEIYARLRTTLSVNIEVFWLILLQNVDALKIWETHFCMTEKLPELLNGLTESDTDMFITAVLSAISWSNLNINVTEMFLSCALLSKFLWSFMNSCMYICLPLKCKPLSGSEQNLDIWTI